MQNLKRLTVFFLFLSSILTFSVGANENKAVDIQVVTELLPPYQITDAEGKPTGYAVDFVEKLLEEANVDASIEIYPWSRTYKIASKQKNVIIFSLARTHERESKFNWIGEIYKERYTFLKLKGNNSVKVKSLDEAKKYSVTVAEDSVGDHMLTKMGFSQLDKTSGFDQCIKMVVNKRTDLILASTYALRHSLTPSELTSDKLEIVYQFTSNSSGLYVAMSQGSDPNLVSQFKTAFEKLKKQGTLNKLREKWNI